MADGGYLKNRKIAMSETAWLILTKFCTMTYISPPDKILHGDVDFASGS